MNYAIEKPIMSVSVLDKWLDQLKIIDTASLIKQQNGQSKGSSINIRPNSTSDISMISNSYRINKKHRNSQLLCNHRQSSLQPSNGEHNTIKRSN